MKYMGSKARIAKEILPIILKNRNKNQWYIEPFCGGCNTLDRVSGNRIGNDIHPQLIAMYKKLVETDWLPPSFIHENYYNHVKINQKKYPQYIVGYIGFALSFGAKWFGGYRHDKKNQHNNIENMKIQSKRAFENIKLQKKLLQGVDFYNLNYYELKIPPNSIIYCDPPYMNTTKYTNKNKFNYDEFWEWCKEETLKRNIIFVSEYNAPINWKIIWQKEITTGLDTKTTKKDMEKLFVYNNK